MIPISSNFLSHDQPSICCLDLTLLLPPRADPNRATEGCEKTPIEIAMGVLLFEDGSYVHYRQNFEMLMILASFVNAETTVSTKFDILKVILERDEKSESYPEQFKKNLMGLSVSEVEENAFIQILAALAALYLST